MNQQAYQVTGDETDPKPLRSVHLLSLLDVDHASTVSVKTIKHVKEDICHSGAALVPPSVMRFPC